MGKLAQRVACAVTDVLKLRRAAGRRAGACGVVLVLGATRQYQYRA
jgi:hypothetical protein